MSIKLIEGSLDDGTKMLELSCSVTGICRLGIASEVDVLFASFARTIGARQRALMEEEYEAVLAALSAFSEGKCSSWRDISVETAVIAYRMNLTDEQIERGSVTLSLPSAEFLYKKTVRGNRKAMYGQYRVALRNSVEPTLPSLEGELVQLKLSYLSRANPDQIQLPSGVTV